jgi:hypothetical protein
MASPEVSTNPSREAGAVTSQFPSAALPEAGRLGHEPAIAGAASVANAIAAMSFPVCSILNSHF